MAMLRAVFAFIMVSVLLVACGSSPGTPAPMSVPQPNGTKVDAIVTFDGVRHACVVSLYSEPQGSAVPCGDVASFLRDELRLATGAVYDIRTIPDFDEAEIARVKASLKGAGYRLGGEGETQQTPIVR